MTRPADKDRLILADCRSGRRSKLAVEILVELGYTNLREFVGIANWPYEDVFGHVAPGKIIQYWNLRNKLPASRSRLCG